MSSDDENKQGVSTEEEKPVARRQALTTLAALFWIAAIFISIVLLVSAAIMDLSEIEAVASLVLIVTITAAITTGCDIHDCRTHIVQ